MTYCVGILLDAGVVFASDSRTNAGVDQVSTFKKMTIYEQPADRVVVVLSSGNLSLTQNAVSLFEQSSRGRAWRAPRQCAGGGRPPAGPPARRRRRAGRRRGRGGPPPSRPHAPRRPPAGGPAARGAAAPGSARALGAAPAPRRSSTRRY